MVSYMLLKILNNMIKNMFLLDDIFTWTHKGYPCLEVKIASYVFFFLQETKNFANQIF